MTDLKLTPKRRQVLEALGDGPKTVEEVRRLLCTAGNPRNLLTILVKLALASSEENIRSRQEQTTDNLRATIKIRYNVYSITQKGIKVLSN